MKHVNFSFVISVKAGIATFSGQIMTGTTSTGCFYRVRVQNSRVDYNGANVNDMQLSAIDPSRSNNIYGKSNTVTPLSRSTRFFIKY